MSVKEKVLQAWQPLDDKFSALKMREKLLVAGVFLLLLYLVWDIAIASPMAKQHQKLVSRFDAANRELQLVSAQEKVLVKALGNDPDAAKRREVLRLGRQLDEANKRLQAMSVGLLSAQQLPDVLHAVLLQSKQVELLGMRSLAPAKLELAKPDVVPEEEDETDNAVSAVRGTATPQVNGNSVAEERIIGVYKNAVQLQLKGDYFSVVAYLQQLENLPWRLYWDFVRYDVDTYPKAVITLKVYTLSTEKGVLGV